MSIKYIDNNRDKGIKIDWNKIFRAFKKLGIPEQFYDPTELPIREVNWCALLSNRSVGKTTQLLVIGLLLYKEYKIQTGYIRQTKAMTTSTKTKNLYTTINETGLISKIFGDDWNSTYLWQSYVYLCKRDEMGNMIEKQNDPICILLSVDRSEEYKSSLTLPRCDWLIFDEFLSSTYRTNEIVDLCQTISTIKRNRISTKVICSTNMVAKYGMYLNEFCIDKVVEKLKPDESEIVETPLGLRMYVKIIEDVRNKDKKHVQENLSYFGFKNKELASITGAEWQIRNYPHLMRPEENESRELITRNVYIYAFGHYVCMEFYSSNVMGNYVNFRPYELTIPPDDAIIFTDQIPKKSNEIYGVGNGTPFLKLWNLYRAHRDYYASNDIGYMVETFIKSIDRTR